MAGKKEIWGGVPLSLNKDKRVRQNDQRVYVAIASFVGKKAYCWPSLKKISERSGVHVSHVSKHTKHLGELGYIRVVRLGKRRNNVYYITSPEIELRRTDTARTAGNDYARAARNDYAERAYCDYAPAAGSNIKRTSETTLNTTYQNNNEDVPTYRPEVIALVESVRKKLTGSR